MAATKVPMDLLNAEPKVALKLTKRQLICFGIAIAIGVPIYFLTRNALGTDGAVIVMMIIMLPFFFLGLYKKDGQPAEKIVKNYLNALVLRPRIRIYQTAPAPTHCKVYRKEVKSFAKNNKIQNRSQNHSGKTKKLKSKVPKR